MKGGSKMGSVKGNINTPSLAGGGVKQPSQSFPSGIRPEEDESVFSKSYTCAFCKERATKAVIFGAFSAFTPTCDAHEAKAREKIEKSIRDEVDGLRDLPLLKSEPSPTDTEGAVLIPPHEQVRKAEQLPEFREKAEVWDDTEDDDE
jgi:hypothetical protein